MKEKLLFWIDVSISQFCIAKFMQEKLDANFYAIYDLSHAQKNTFKEQNIIDFKKFWFFWDEIKNNVEKPDLVYLRQIEQKYKLNLWMLINSERIFHEFNNYYRFTQKEILAILENECRFFEKVLEEIKPDFLIIKLTDYHRNHLLAEMCKNSGVKILMLMPSKLGFRGVIGTDFNKFDNEVYLESLIFDKNVEELLSNSDVFKQTTKVKTMGDDVSIRKKISVAFDWIINVYNDEYKQRYDHLGKTRSKLIYTKISSLVKSRHRKNFLYRNSILKIPDNEKSVYFPLHVEPERTIDIDAPFYSNQLNVISLISKALPIDYNLYVKEHFNMRLRNWRDVSFYKKILTLPNVKLLNPSLKPNEIIRKSDLVITIAGTTGLEAALNNKPVIVFADVVYSSLSSVFRVEKIEDLPQLIITALQSQVNREEVVKMIGKLYNSSFEFDMVSLHNDIVRSFYNGGFNIGNEISMKDMNSFMEEHRDILEGLASEHIKKINQHKKSTDVL